MSKWPNSTQEQDRPNTFFFQKNMPAHKIFFFHLERKPKKNNLVVRLFVRLLQVSGHKAGPIKLKICIQFAYHLGKDMGGFETANFAR